MGENRPFRVQSHLPQKGCITLSCVPLEQVNCLNCNHSTHTNHDAITWRETPLQFVFCNGCGLKYMNPRPQQTWLLNFYREAFWQEKLENKGYQETQNSKQAISKDQGTKINSNYQQSRAMRIFDILEPVLSLSEDSEILEIGASFGQTLKYFQKKTGCRAWAVEPSEAAANYLESQSLQRVGKFMEDLQDRPDLEGRFSCIIISHVLENVVDPLNALRWVRQLLTPQGRLYIDTTNLYYRNDVNPYHMCIFTPETLAAMLGRAGFRIVKQHFENYPDQRDRGRKIFDPYIAVVSEPGPEITLSPCVDLDQIRANQVAGERLFEQGRLENKRRNRQLHSKVVRKLRAMAGLPQIWNLAPVQDPKALRLET